MLASNYVFKTRLDFTMSNHHHTFSILTSKPIKESTVNAALIKKTHIYDCIKICKIQTQLIKPNKPQQLLTLSN